MAKLKILPKKYDMLDANSSFCRFRINIDVLNEAFGVGRSMYPRAVYPDTKGGSISGDDPDDCFIIWMPKLYANSSEWKNSISSDNERVYEIAEETRKTDWMEFAPQYKGKLRLVFVKELPNSAYRFAGVFKEGEMNHLKHTYERIATKVELIGNPVNKIRLIDDIR